MNKFAVAFVIVSLLLSLCACGNDNTDNNISDSNDISVPSQTSNDKTVSEENPLFDNSSLSDAPSDLFEWCNTDGGLEITAYKGTYDIVVIPEIIDNKKVVSLGNAFSGNVSIKKMVVPKYVETFNLSGCDNLERLEFLGDNFDANYDSSMPNRALRALPDHIDNLCFTNATKIHMGIFKGAATVDKLEFPVAEEVKYFTKIPVKELVIRNDIMYCSSGPQYKFEIYDNAEWGTLITPENAADIFCGYFGVDTIIVNGETYTK